MLRQLQEVLLRDGRLSPSDLMRIPTEEPSVAGGKLIFEAALRGSMPELKKHLTEWPKAVDWHNPDQGCLGSGFEASGATALMAAALRGPISPVDALLQAGANPSVCERAGGWNAVHYAAWGGHVTVLRRFSLAEAPIDDEDELGRTPLYLAVRQGHNQAVRYLLEMGADAEHQAKRGFTPLMLASKQNKPQIVRTLIHHGVDVDRTKDDGYTALHLAACNGHSDVAALLLTLGKAAVDPENEEGCTPLMLAAGGCLETNRNAARMLRQLIVAHYLSRGNAGALAGSGVLELLAGALLPNQAHSDLIRICLRHGADPSKTNRNKETALMFVASRNEVEGMLALLNHPKIRVDQAAEEGWTALMYACRAGHVSAVKALLDAGADPLREKQDGFTAKKLAEMNNNEKIIKLIEDKLGAHEAISVASMLRENDEAEDDSEGVEETKDEAAELLRSRKLSIAADAVSLETVIAEGSFGSAFRGKYNDDEVVVKRIAKPASLTPESELAVIRSIGMQMAMDSEYVARVFGLCHLQLPGSDRASLCMVMEYAEGGTLAQFTKACAGRGTMEASAGGETTEVQILPACLLLILYEASLGLEYIHQKGMVHRDIKPHNVLLGRDLKPKIADFGLSKQLAAGATNDVSDSVAATMAFLAPEQWMGMLPSMLRLPLLSQSPAEVRTSADAYSFGLLIKYVLHGCYDVADIDGSVMELRRMPLPELPSSAEVNDKLSIILSRCLEQDPTSRYGPDSTEQKLLSSDLLTALNLAGGSAREASTKPEIRDAFPKLASVVATRQLQYVAEQEEVSAEAPASRNANEATATGSDNQASGGSSSPKTAERFITAIVDDNQETGKEICEESDLNELLAKPVGQARVTPLHIAVHIGRQWAVEMILGLPLTPSMLDARDVNDRTPLILAAAQGHTTIAILLLEKGAEVDAIDSFGATALCVAAAKGSTAVASVLVAQHAAVDHREHDQCTPLLNAALGGHDEIAALLLAKGADIEATESDGWTPLLFACRKGFLHLVKMLVEAGAQIDKTRPNGTSPLCMAAEAGHEAVASFLLQTGADIEVAMHNGATPLCVSAQNGHEGIVRKLLEHGSEVEATEVKGWTPLLNAAFAGHGGIIKLLVAHGAQIEVRKDGGATPLIVAATRDSADALDVLLEAGADIESQNDDGLSALSVAAHFGNEVCVRKLIEKGADFESANNEGWRPLHLACLRGHQKVVKLLIEQKADLNATKDNGATALHIAAEQGHEAIVEQLVQEDIDLEIREDGGWTPLHNAALAGNEKIVKLLLDKGADPTAEKVGGLGAEDIAAREGHAGVVQLLRKQRGEEVEAEGDGSNGDKEQETP